MNYSLEKNSITNFHIPRWEELPEIDLYLDQIVNLLENYLNNYIEDEKIITKTMINNYVKQKILEAPIKKKYNKKHIATLFVICILKQVYSINDIGNLISLSLKTTSIEKAYNKFCIALESSIECVFENKPYIDDEKMTLERYLLKNVVQSVACKLYVEKNHFEQ